MRPSDWDVRRTAAHSAGSGFQLLRGTVGTGAPAHLLSRGELGFQPFRPKRKRGAKNWRAAFISHGHDKIPLGSIRHYVSRHVGQCRHGCIAGGFRVGEVEPDIIAGNLLAVVNVEEKNGAHGLTLCLLQTRRWDRRSGTAADPVTNWEMPLPRDRSGPWFRRDPSLQAAARKGASPWWDEDHG
jgi:hypothetical protein